ncbi:MAG: winged helix-turn-helix domain-containing protein [Methanolobus sp.]|nr:winged helix-turn-helix domain-containing protein [Methanolobus sp.]
MKKPLTDVLFMSEKRKNVLLLLQDGAKEMEFLLDSLSTTRQALLPQVRILEDYHLTTHYNDTYELTTIGKVIVNKMFPLLNTLLVFDDDIDYWGKHRIDFIPPYLLKRINELGKCKIITPPLIEAYELLQEFQLSSYNSMSLYGVTTFFHPHFNKLFYELISNNVNIYVIITEELLNDLLLHHRAVFEGLIKNSLFHAFVCQHIDGFLSFAFNDKYILLDLLMDNGEYDNKHILCSNSESLKWGKELFDHYLKNSTAITDV